MKTERLLSPVDVARRLDADVSRVYELIFSGHLEGGPTAEKVVRIPESGLRRYLEERSSG